jgi:hypothetical protein
VAKPAEKKDPKGGSDNEIEKRRQDPPLEQLSQSWNKEAGERGNDVA